MKVEELKALAEKATPGPWKWQGEDYRGGWGWQLLVNANGEGIACGEAGDGSIYKHLRAHVPIAAEYCKTGMEANADSAPCLHIRQPDAAYIAALSPERVLAMIRVIEAAKEVRANLIFGTDLPPITDFDVALAALEDQ